MKKSILFLSLLLVNSVHSKSGFTFKILNYTNDYIVKLKNGFEMSTVKFSGCYSYGGHGGYNLRALTYKQVAANEFDMKYSGRGFCNYRLINFDTQLKHKNTEVKFLGNYSFHPAKFGVESIDIFCMKNSHDLGTFNYICSETPLIAGVGGVRSKNLRFIKRGAQNIALRIHDIDDPYDYKSYLPDLDGEKIDKLKLLERRTTKFLKKPFLCRQISYDQCFASVKKIKELKLSGQFEGEFFHVIVDNFGKKSMPGDIINSRYYQIKDQIGIGFDFSKSDILKQINLHKLQARSIAELPLLLRKLTNDLYDGDSGYIFCDEKPYQVRYADIIDQCKKMGLLMRRFKKEHGFHFSQIWIIRIGKSNSVRYSTNVRKHEVVISTEQTYEEMANYILEHL